MRRARRLRLILTGTRSNLHRSILRLFLGSPGPSESVWVPHVPPEFPMKFGGVGALHAAFLTESRTRGCAEGSVQEIRTWADHDFFACFHATTNSVRWAPISANL